MDSVIYTHTYAHTYVCRYIYVWIYVVFLSIIKEEVKNVRETRWGTREVEERRGSGINVINTVFMFQILNKLNLTCSKELQASNICQCETK